MLVVQRIAFVDVNPEHSSSLMKFAETAAVNRGLNIRVFSSLFELQKDGFASPIL